MSLSKVATLLDAVAKALARYLNLVAAGILAVMMLLTVTDVGLRYFLSRPIKGSFEITSFMMAIVISFALAFCAARGSHIRVDVVVTHLPRRVQAVMATFNDLVTLALLSLIVWQSYRYVILLHKANTLSTVGHIPHWPFVVAVLLGMVVLALVSVKNLVADVRLVLKGDDV
jgi:TRAP-type C4-dicarboxylate transport system permease small subunit